MKGGAPCEQISKNCVTISGSAGLYGQKTNTSTPDSDPRGPNSDRERGGGESINLVDAPYVIHETPYN